MRSVTRALFALLDHFLAPWLSKGRLPPTGVEAPFLVMHTYEIIRWGDIERNVFLIILALYATVYSSFDGSAPLWPARTVLCPSQREHVFPKIEPFRRSPSTSRSAR
jgi:hypothetical protein